MIVGGAGILVLEVATHHLGTTAAACQAPFAEQIDPLSSQHLLPDAAEPPYLSNPPTSGAHKPGIHPTGVLTTPIERPIQVSLLEQGYVLVQYRDVPTATRTELSGLARSDNYVTIAPNATLSSPIVLTSWLFKMNCTRFDDAAMHQFIADHIQKAPTH
jgi:hypothetical protein